MKRPAIAKPQPALIAAATLLTAAGLLAGSARHLAQEAVRARDQALQERDRAIAELRAAQAADDAQAHASAQLQKLVAEGAFTADDPESRQEQLRASQLALRLPELRHRFGSPQPWPGGEAGAYAWNATPLHLELELLHEGDLPDFLTRIGRLAPLLVRECRLFRLGEPPRMRADCELQWLGIRHSGSGS